MVQFHLFLLVAVADVLDLAHCAQHVGQEAAHLAPLFGRLRHVITIAENSLKGPELLVKLNRIERVFVAMHQQETP